MRKAESWALCFFLEEAFDSEATEEIQTPSNFSALPSQFRTQTEEIKDLVPELMPQIR
jgi:hypothetical protein